MALSSATFRLTSLSFSTKKTNRNPKNPSLSFTITNSSSFDEPRKPSLASSSSSTPPIRVSSSSAPKARFISRQKQSVSVRQLQRPLIEYMSLPASQYSVLDAERIERVDDNTFRCYVYTFKFFNFEVCPVLLVRVEEQPNGCCIKLLSCKLEGSPVVVAQNDKFDASMVNRVSCDSTGEEGTSEQQITSDAVIEVNIEIPFAFRVFPVEAIEATGTQVLDQILLVGKSNRKHTMASRKALINAHRIIRSTAVIRRSSFIPAANRTYPIFRNGVDFGTRFFCASPQNFDIDLSNEENKRRTINRLLYRSKQRGFLELDLVLGNWVEENVKSMDENGVKSLIHVLNLENPDLWKWLTDQEQPPEALSSNPVFSALHEKVMKNLNKHAAPETRAAAGQPWVRGWDDFKKGRDAPIAGNQ